MTDSTISFNTPMNVKLKLQRMADNNGVTISDLMRMSVMQLLRNGITINPSIEPSSYLLDELRDADAARKSGKATVVADEHQLANYLDSLKK